MPTSITIMLTVFLVLVLAIYVFKDKLVTLLDWVLKILAVICTVIALSSLFLPVIYKNLAQNTLESAGILKTIRDIDSATDLNKIIQPGEQILNDLGSWLTGSQNTLATQTGTSGKLETDLYPKLVDGLAGIYIIIALTLSLGGIAGVVYLSFTTSSITETQALKNKYKKIEERVRLLENNESLSAKN